MASNTIPPVRGLEVYGGYTGYKQKSDAASVAESTFSNLSPEDTGRKVWCETIWANLSKQAIDHDLPRIQYFDTKTMLLSKEVNKKLWSQVVGTVLVNTDYLTFSIRTVSTQALAQIGLSMQHQRCSRAAR
jgi:hypothetical protein